MKPGRVVENRTKVTAGKRLLESLDRSRDAIQAYETLMTSLHVFHTTQPLKTILVTSSQPGEGKTTVTVNLAVTMALAGRNVLVVDADLRKPRLHHVFGLENNPGTAEILAGKVTLEEIVDITQFVDLDVVPASNQKSLGVVPGGAVPGDFSATGLPKLREALDYFRPIFDFVLIDSPPVLSVNDPLLLAPLVDGVIVIINTGVVTEEEVKRAKERLEQGGGRILGVVMNGFDEKIHGPGFHPYHSYYE